MPAPTLSKNQRVALAEVMGRVKDRMRALDMSGNELAGRLETSGSAVSEWFTKGRVPLLHHFLLLPRILQCDGHWLITGEGDWHRRHSDEPPDDAAIQGGLAIISQIEGAVDEIRGRLDGRLKRVQPSQRSDSSA